MHMNFIYVYIYLALDIYVKFTYRYNALKWINYGVRAISPEIKWDFYMTVVNGVTKQWKIKNKSWKIYSILKINPA